MKNMMKGFIFLFAFGHSLMDMADPIEIKQVLKTTNSWNDVPLPGFSSGQTEFTVLTFKIAPGAKTAIHMHPMNGAGYVLSGELTMYATKDPHGNFADNKLVKKINLTTGQAWTETVNTLHYGENNTKNEVKFILIFAGAAATPPTLSITHN